MRWYIIALVVCVMYSCVQKNEDNINVVSLKKGVLNGDISSYEKLSSYYFRNGIDSLLPYSKIMADKFYYARAYYDVFEIIYLSNSGGCVDYNLSCLDNEEKKVALDYFIKAIKKGDESASDVLLKFYVDGKSYPIKEIYEDVELVELAKSNIESK